MIYIRLIAVCFTTGFFFNSETGGKVGADDLGTKIAVGVLSSLMIIPLHLTIGLLLTEKAKRMASRNDNRVIGYLDA